MFKFKLPNFRKGGSKTSNKKAVSKTSRKGSILSGLGGMLGGLFGNNNSSISNSNVSGLNTYSPSKSSANYGPLPSFTTSTESVKKYNNPTLADVSVQMGRIISKVAVVEKILKDQLEFRKFEYKEKSRIQREINAEAKNVIDTSTQTKDLSGIDMSAIQLALSNLITSADNAINNLENNANSNGGFLPLTGGSKSASGTKPRDYSFVKKDEALKDGKLKRGYESVTDKNGRIIGYRRNEKLGVKTAKKLSSNPSLLSKSKGIISEGLTFVGKVAGKAATPVLAAYGAWQAWKEIKNIPPGLSPDDRKKEITKIVAGLVARFGVAYAGMSLGALAGGAATSVTGPGALAGVLIGAGGGLAGGIAADYFLGDSAEEIAEALVDKIMPTKKPKAAPKQISTFKSSSTDFSQPIAKPNVVKRKKDSTTLNDLINRSADRVGVDSSILSSVVKALNSNISLSSSTENLSGQQVFNLSDDQWNDIKNRHGSTFIELTAGKNNLKSASLAAALLIKDAQEFLDSNNIPSTQENLISTYLVGNQGIKDLLKSNPNTPVNKVVPDAVRKRPEAFIDSNGNVLSSGEFLHKEYNIDNGGKSSFNKSDSSTPRVDQSDNSLVSKPTLSKSTQNNVTSNISPVSSPALSEISNSSTSSSSENQSMDGTSSSNSTDSKDASPVQQNSSAVPPIGEAINAASNEVQNLETSKGNEVEVVAPSSQGSNQQSINGDSSGYAGTGEVPDPTFSLGSIESQVYFTSTILSPAYAGEKA